MSRKKGQTYQVFNVVKIHIIEHCFYLDFTMGRYKFCDSEYIVRGSNSKVNTDMTFALARDVRDALLEFADTRGNVFMIKHTKDHYPKIRLASGIEEFTFRWMRNLSVNALSTMDASLGDLTALLLGHNDSSTIKKYLSLQRERQEQGIQMIFQQNY